MACAEQHLGLSTTTRAAYADADFKIDGTMTNAWFATSAAAAMADAILSYQTPTGGWSKHIDCGEARAVPHAEPIVVMAPGHPRRRRARDSTTAAIIAPGRHHWHQRTRISIERAIAILLTATERDASSVHTLIGGLSI